MECGAGPGGPVDRTGRGPVAQPPGPADAEPGRAQIYLGGSSLNASSGSIFESSSAAPAGYFPVLSKWATMSAACAGVNVPGAVAGMVVCVFSKSSPTLFPLQLVRKSLPARGGMGPDPSRLSPWQAAHCSL